jgi:biotin carboxylase
MMYDAEADRVSIIEINPRMASQFADLYEKVDGTSSYTVLLDIARGRTPQFTRRQGRYGFAASIVLRSFEDTSCPPRGRVTSTAQNRYPDLRSDSGEGGRALSSEMRDGAVIVTASSISAGGTGTMFWRFAAC